MPNYSLIANRRGESMFTPYGPSGPHYNLLNPDPLNIGGLPKHNATPENPGGWIQTPNPQADLYAWLYRPQNEAKYDPQTGRYAYPGSMAERGVRVPYSDEFINPNDPNQRYRPVDIVKSPAVAGAQTDLMASFKKGAADSMKGFDEWLSTFKSGMGDALSKSRAATDPSQTISALRTNQSRYNAALGESQRNYADLNARTAAGEQAIVQEARDLLPAYDAAAEAAANRSMNLLKAGVSRYKAGSGTPASLGSSEQQQLLRGAADILVPMEQAKIAQRYNVLGQFAMPTTLDVANRETARISQFDPMVAQQQFQTGNVTEQTIQGLLTVTARMAREDAVAFMQAMGVPVQLQQQILSGQIAQLDALGQLEEQSRYRGLQDRLGAELTQPQYFSTNTGSYPNQGRYNPVGLTGGTRTTGLPADNAPTQAAPPAANDWYFDQDLQSYVNRGTGDVSNNATLPGEAPPVNRYSQAMRGLTSGRQTNSYYDPDLGVTIDRTTGEITSDGYLPGETAYDPRLIQGEYARGMLGNFI